MKDPSLQRIGYGTSWAVSVKRDGYNGWLQ